MLDSRSAALGYATRLPAHVTSAKQAISRQTHGPHSAVVIDSNGLGFNPSKFKLFAFLFANPFHTRPSLNEPNHPPLTLTGAQRRTPIPLISFSAPPKCRRPIGTAQCVRATNHQLFRRNHCPAQPSQHPPQSHQPEDATYHPPSRRRHPTARGHPLPVRCREEAPRRPPRRRAPNEHRRRRPPNGCLRRKR